jgi:hypothetical protein
MKRPILPRLVATFAVIVALPTAAHGPGAHVHGVAKLDVAVEGDTLTLGLESPLDNLLGFEHMPRTEKQKAAVRAMADTLNKPAALFVPTPAAQCAPATVKLESPVLKEAKKDAGDGHADLDGDFVFRCAHPDALQDIEVKLFGAFPHLRQVDVQVVSPQGQTAARLTPKQQRVSW